MTSKKLSFIRRALGIIWAASPGWTVVWITLTLVLGVLPAASVVLTKWVVDTLSHVVGHGFTEEHAMQLLLPAALVLGVMLAQRFLGALNGFGGAIQTQLVQEHIRGLMHVKSATVDYGFFESPEYFDQAAQAGQASGRILNVLGNLGGLAQCAVTFVCIGGILVRYSIWLPLVLLVSSLPAFYVLMQHNRRVHALWKEMTADRRLAGYLDGVLSSHQTAAEIRINDLCAYFDEKHRVLAKRLWREELKLNVKRNFAGLTAGLIAMIVTGLAMCWIVWRAMQGHATLGDLALFYQSFNQGQGLARGLLSGMGEIHSNVLYLEQVFDYLDAENLIKDPPEPVAFPTLLRRGIHFEDVSFTYTDKDRPAVDRFKLTIPAGKIVAIVGENGSGKSTLIKLLCRFYDPGRGRITVDGIDLRELAQRELRRQIAVMFQFPVKYHLTVAENIRVGDLQGEHGPEAVQAAADGAGAHGFIERLPKGYDNLLGRSFAEGAELSGGEWQRLALARAFLRQAQIVVLDEPTSFMDSWAENEWLQRFRTLVHGRTALIITHRFTTAMQADIIHVMDKGRIIESGTHAELMTLGGKYAASWREQLGAGLDADQRTFAT